MFLLLFYIIFIKKIVHFKKCVSLYHLSLDGVDHCTTIGMCHWLESVIHWTRIISKMSRSLQFENKSLNPIRKWVFRIYWKMSHSYQFEMESFGSYRIWIVRINPRMSRWNQCKYESFESIPIWTCWVFANTRFTFVLHN